MWKKQTNDKWRYYSAVYERLWNKPRRVQFFYTRISVSIVGEIKEQPLPKVDKLIWKYESLLKHRT